MEADTLEAPKIETDKEFNKEESAKDEYEDEDDDVPINIAKNVSSTVMFLRTNQNCFKNQVKSSSNQRNLHQKSKEKGNKRRKRD